MGALWVAMARPRARYAGTLYTPGSSVAAINGSTAQVNGNAEYAPVSHSTSASRAWILPSASNAARTW